MLFVCTSRVYPLRQAKSLVLHEISALSEGALARDKTERPECMPDDRLQQLCKKHNQVDSQADLADT